MRSPTFSAPEETPSSGTRLILIRHGEVPEAWRGRYIGRTDPPLSPAGREECRRLAPELRAFRPGRIYASPLLRARESAAIAAAGQPVIEDPRLREIDFGDWENLTFDEIVRIAPPQLIRTWAERPEAMVFPGGESFDAFRRRIDAFTDEVLAAAPRCVAVVTHGGALMRMLCRFRHIPASRQLEVLPRRGTLSCLTFTDGVLTDET